MSETGLAARRRAYADWLIRCADTVTLLTVEEVRSIHERARAGEFDEDLEIELR